MLGCWCNPTYGYGYGYGYGYFTLLQGVVDAPDLTARWASHRASAKSIKKRYPPYTSGPLWQQNAPSEASGQNNAAQRPSSRCAF